MTIVTRDDVLKQLKMVTGPDLQGDLVSLNLLSDIFIADGKVFFSITVPWERAEELEQLRLAAQKVVMDIDGVTSAIVTLTAEKTKDTSSVPPKPLSIEPKKIVVKPDHGPAHGHDRAAPPPRTPVDGVKHIIAVFSGKGGVGKSTTAINLALALQSLGLKTGLMDADIYGPSLPRLVGLVDHKPKVLDDKNLEPIEKFGLKMMSMGFMVDESKPIVWRGPMVMSAITQLLRNVVWSPLDVLVVDMPPGTGDAQLTLAQQVQLAGAVIVSTPQDLALIDARKGIEMFDKVGIPVLGVIENMSYFIAPDTGKRYDIFGHGGAKKEAMDRGVTFLGEIPLDPDVRALSDAGTPIFVARPDSPQTKRYGEIATQIKNKLF